MQNPEIALRKYVRSENWSMQTDSDQNRGIPAPPIMLSPSGKPLTELPKPGECSTEIRPLLEVVNAAA